MSEGLFGWLFGGSLGGGRSTSPIRTAEEIARHQHEQMRNVQRTDSGYLALAMGAAAVPREELKRRMDEHWAREFEARHARSKAEEK